MSEHKALIVDDEPDILELLEITLERMNIDCSTAADINTAKFLLKDKSFDICLTDMRLPDGDGVDLVAYMQEKYPNIPVAVITAHGNMETAISALKSGAFDFLTKPVDLTLLRNLIDNALCLSDKDENIESRLVGKSEIITELTKTISKLARSQAPVYISGESGVGKELVARMIHEQGARSEQPFVPVNCGAIPNDLMEAEFFGYKKGSFTGAIHDKQGFFQAADGGTLFLDEVAELPQHMQVKLLRAIQEKTVRPIGQQHEVPVNVRLLSATHKDLTVLVEKGQFRHDLFYRINVIELHINPLRERIEDIPLLIEHILKKLAAEAGAERPKIHKQVIEQLKFYSFPGNIRELENILERAMTLCNGKIIEPGDLQIPKTSRKAARHELAGSDSDDDMELDTYLVNVEREKILKVLEETRWNKTAAAKSLGISFRALRYRLEKLGIE